MKINYFGIINPLLWIQFISLLARTKAFFAWNWVLTNPHNVQSNRRLHDISSTDYNTDRFRLKDEHTDTERTAKHDLTCRYDDQCSIGSFCDLHYGICKLYRTVGDLCRNDNQCQPGLQCSFGQCMVTISPGHQGARCNVDNDCLSDYCCARHHGQKICKKKLGLGRLCFVPEGGLAYYLNEMCPCIDGLICDITSEHIENPSSLSWLKGEKSRNDNRKFRCVRS